MRFLCYLSLLTGTFVVPGLAGVEKAQNGSSVYQALYSSHSNSTPIFQSSTERAGNPLIHALQGAHGSSLNKRDDNGLPVGTCAPGKPCSNGACCSKTGICGFAPDQCGQDKCISNCKAKAECGQYAAPGSKVCPLNVCCSKFGFCGTTEDFCGTDCQSGFGGCGAVNRPACGGQSAIQRTIGYYEGWASTRRCDKRLPRDLDITGLTHINFAFAYFHPTTFQMIPMEAQDTKLYPQFTALKTKKPGLKTWISIGGWTFNDATNSPNTQMAFSDMAGSAENRQMFIKSLLVFLQTWGFDGADLDWEYPGADDRGGISADTANYISLLKDLKQAFGARYGLSVTLPASYWYLRWFDLKSMQQHVDFLNIMTYDIHGVWDSSNKFTGPYIRPHTNLTEIKQGLDLLWRNDVDPSVINLGLGWYGRSFTLKDPSCNKPGCVFEYGGSPGECTNSSGTLSNAEIQRVIAKNAVTPIFDEQAAVKWISFGSDQWVSYDDGETMQMKINAANELCLGGTLIWALDQDSADHTSSNDFMGVGVANGVSIQDAQKFRDLQTGADQAATLRNSCYWSYCGEECVPGYISETYAKGQVAGIQRDLTCKGDDVQTLCCAPGTDTGKCGWYGWRGVGMPCTSNVCPTDMDLIAVNTNSYENDEFWSGQIRDLTCNGGSQSYCCSGFVPSTYANTDSLSLEGKDSIAKRSFGGSKDPTCLDMKSGTLMGLIGGTMGFPILALGQLGLSFTSLFGTPKKCVKQEQSNAHDEQAGVIAVNIANQIGQGALGTRGLHMPTATVKPKVDKPPQKFGDYAVSTFNKDDDDCQTTYTCRYDKGFDEICDNQRWGIDKALGGKRVYHKAAVKRPGKTYKDNWKEQRVKEFRWFAQHGFGTHGEVGREESKGRARCDVDEFPMAALKEGQKKYQVVRLANGIANEKQGNDFKDWISAVWNPCSSLRAKNKKEEPPITWAFGPFKSDDPRKNARTDGEHFLAAYGFNSQTRDSSCWATYTYTVKGYENYKYTSIVSDQGFRVLRDDPLFTKYKWPEFNKYWADPSEENLPTDIFDGQWLKREVALAVLEQDLPPTALEEAEILSSSVTNQLAQPNPTPTDPSANSIPWNDAYDADTSRPLLSVIIPQETGAA